MRRKILMGILAIALPIGTVAAVQTTAHATTPPPDPARNCTVDGIVHFAAPGLSKNGTISSTAKTTNVTTSGTNFGGGCTGSIPPQTIKIKSTKCKGPNNPPNTACQTKHTYWYDGEAAFASQSTVATITKSLKKLSFTLDGVLYQTKTSSASEIFCADGGVGFKISGSVKKPKQDKGQSSVASVCLLGDSGPGTTGNFFSDLGSGTGTIVTATIDGGVGGSTVTIH